MAKYSVHQQPVETLLSWIKSGDIAIPEIQRPFVWKASKVRDLIDSLYQGYPVGYIITWRNPDVKLKNGELSAGKKVLIDGQQRLTTSIILINELLNQFNDNDGINFESKKYWENKFLFKNVNAEFIIDVLVLLFEVTLPSNLKGLSSKLKVFSV